MSDIGQSLRYVPSVPAVRRNKPRSSEQTPFVGWKVFVFCKKSNSLNVLKVVNLSVMILLDVIHLYNNQPPPSEGQI